MRERKRAPAVMSFHNSVLNAGQGSYYRFYIFYTSSHYNAMFMARYLSHTKYGNNLN